MTFSVMTFNLRYDRPMDGPHAWPHRREAAAALIRDHAPLIVGTQEGLAVQLDELEALLSDYASFGLGRRGERSDEHCRIFFRADALRLLRHGDFWLSDTPEQVGSITPAWGNELPRMVTWGEFASDQAGASFTFLNSHLDHASPVARERGAAQIVRFLAESPLPHPTILAGDLNAPPGSPPVAVLTGELPAAGTRSPLRDACSLAGGRDVDRPTFHAFTGVGRERIDYILVEPPLRVLRYQVLDEPVQERWPSDHFPVLATLELS